MTESNLAALDGARMIHVESRPEAGYYDLVVAWYGGTQFRVFADAHYSGEYALDARGVFNYVGDDGTGPADADEAEEYAEEWIEETVETLG